MNKKEEVGNEKKIKELKNMQGGLKYRQKWFLGSKRSAYQTKIQTSKTGKDNKKNR